MPLKFYIETIGCQMNVLDSELAMAGLIEAGYQPVSAKRYADIVLFNTCSVRQHAEDKIYSALGRLKHWKEQKPGMIIGVMGCMAQKDKEAIFKRAPHVDIVLGPGQLQQLPDLVKAVESDKQRQIAVSLDRMQGIGNRGKGIGKQGIRVGSWKLEVGSWKLEARKLEVGSWKAAVKRRAQSVERRAQSAECKTQRAECKAQRAEC